MRLSIALALILCGVLVHAQFPGVQNISQLIEAEGYPCENYWFETPDGFLLGVQRIPYGRSGPSANRPVAFLQHGLLDSATTWVMNNPNESLAYILADAGFDVYVGNARGNTYSLDNVNYPIKSKALWDLVDFDNMISIDAPVMIQNALRISQQEKLVYVGHSQGTVMGFGAFSTNPQLAAMVNLFVALAPVAVVSHQTSRVLTYMANLNVAEWLALFGEERFLPEDWLLEALAGSLCKTQPEVCEDVIFALCGYNRANLNATRMPVYMSHTPAGTSVRNMLHWTQAVKSGKFQMFDYGTQGNKAHYNSTTPPQYPLAQLTSPPMVFFTGTNDDLADPTDVQWLLQALPASNKPVLVHNEDSYEHLDFVWGMDAHVKIYPLLVEYAQKYSK
eukprot:TRINITY_DN18834_c0_g1_i1.p2 TRINITY_DN18834_c0_g1~~TRINITY_DN18834_c0_g1_i1.p2  ORF type:complete len:391 (+),score=140.83 TRINITY_DN18834_c0_g1_i1:88-1260(+)